RITLHQRKLEQLEQLKNTLLSKMFPKSGTNIPEIRFSGFTDAWKQRKLKEMLEERNELILESKDYPLMSFVQGKGVIPKSNRYDRSFLVKNDKKKYKKTELNDFIYSSNNLETGSIGFNKTGNAVISPVYSIFKSKNKLESRFIGIISRRKDFIAKMLKFRQGVVYGQWKIDEDDFLNISVFTPNIETQKYIIDLFIIIDNYIAIHQRKLEQLKNLKQTLLNKMFI
ncbi:restriction endonuclease subunit S, partial [Enterococcus cecorum]|uniref:restriction endonuclease subunit S n=1 Tax=Enterococcus cecorum TaxID=44008 RepID=UPI002ACA3503